ncbi:4'-phosphopantetheinyl transferase superfamily protein [Chryseobacterium sp. NRRL B-14859]|uniref:4'-phosphopantetheinyl transferase family protein n=1 Tax=Chryseobacterium sp. NRRL B-14859 TaxID=1562763 RepID=UPI0033940DD6
MVILYTLISEEKHQDLLDRYIPAFSENFKNKILKYRRWQDAQLSLLGRVLLQHGLRVYHNITEAEIDFLSSHKPFLKGHAIYFNISHSKNLVVCAIADFPVGIDVEFSDTSINYQDFKFQMTPGEFDKINTSADTIHSFFTYWTEKEAVIKAHGDGMMIPLDSFEILHNECIIDGKKFFTKEVFIDDQYLSCIASDDPIIKDREIIFDRFQI